MASINFFLQKPYLKPGSKTPNPNKTRLYCFLIIPGDIDETTGKKQKSSVIKIKTEHEVYPVQWDFSKQRKKDKIAGAIEFNKKLMELEDDILTQYYKIKKEFPEKSFVAVSEELKQYGRTKEISFVKNKGFFEVLEHDYIGDYLKANYAKGTQQKFTTLLKSLKEFGEQYPKYQNLSFDMINQNFRDSYVKFLHEQKPRGRQKRRPEDDQKGLFTDTVGKYIECLKTFVGWAKSRKYHSSIEYKDIPVFNKPESTRRKQDHDIVVLTLSELKKFYMHDFSQNKRLDEVRDLFCFEAFTGQRWGDIIKFDKRELQDDVWVLTNQKTKKKARIDLVGYSSPALEILKKYDYNLPVISNQKFNDYIKDAGKEAKIDSPVKLVRYVGVKDIILEGPKHEFLHSHVARATCVSILLNDYNINPFHVKEITNHRDLKTLQKYMKDDHKARKEAMSKTVSITDTMKVVKDQKTA